jgi:hypothetical protein
MHAARSLIQAFVISESFPTDIRVFQMFCSFLLGNEVVGGVEFMVVEMTKQGSEFLGWEKKSPHLRFYYMVRSAE